MPANKPNLPSNYLGQQPTFADIGLSTLSHKDGEIDADSNEVEIKLKMKDPVKITHQLINCRTDEDVSKYVFTQTLFGTVSFKLCLPSSDYYKFQIFGLSEKDDKSSLPNIFNYLINCKQALCPVAAFPKQYAQWKDGCYLKSPMYLHKDMCLKAVTFDVKIPNANAVAVVADGEWFHLEKKGGHFEGTFNLEQFKGKDTKVTLNANTTPNDDTKYSTLLEYRV